MAGRAGEEIEWDGVDRSLTINEQQVAGSTSQGHGGVSCEMRPGLSSDGR